MLNDFDKLYITKEFDNLLGEAGSKFSVVSPKPNTTDDIYGEDYEAIIKGEELYNEPYEFIGLVRYNPKPEEISPKGQEHKVDTIFDITVSQLLKYIPIKIGENDHSKRIILADDHSLITEEGNTLISLTDYIQLDEVKYEIINIKPYSSFRSDILLFKIECVSKKF